MHFWQIVQEKKRVLERDTLKPELKGKVGHIFGGFPSCLTFVGIVTSQQYYYTLIIQMDIFQSRILSILMPFPPVLTLDNKQEDITVPAIKIGQQ